MKNFSSGRGAVGLAALSVAAVLLAAPLCARAQSGTGRRIPTGTGRPSPPGTVEIPNRTAPPSIRERQLKMSELEREVSKPRAAEEERLALAQVAEDFQRLQVVNNRMMAGAFKSHEPDYAAVAEATAEIRRRADRIKVNLALPAPDEKEKEDARKRPEPKRAEDAAQLKAALLTLDRAVMSFVGSPLFKNPSVVEVTQAAKARRDLDEVIELSRLIGKDAERLGKADKR